MIYGISFIISIWLLLGCTQNNEALEVEISFAPENIQKSCTDKCTEEDMEIENTAGIGSAAGNSEIPHHDETIQLIIVSNYQILLQEPKFSYKPPNFIYNSSGAITGMGIHVAKELLFITNVTGTIYKTPLSTVSPQSTVRIYSTESANQIPLALSVDWLSDKLYVLFKNNSMNQNGWQISRCNFDGSQLQMVYSGMQSKPVHFQLDPINGYLFWSLSGESKNDGGLFRLDLSDDSNGVKHEISPTLIFNREKVGVFAIDYIHHKILVPIEGLNTVTSMDLNGDKYEVIRKNTQAPIQKSVKSFAMAQDQFYWTSEDGVLMEEYHEVSKYYYDNHFRDFAKSNYFLFVCVKSPSVQPVILDVVDVSTIEVIGKWNFFTVSWQPIETVDHGEVFYEIRYLNRSIVDKRSFIEVENNKLPPHSQLNISIKAFTHCSSSPIVETQIYSPSVPPPKPLEQRIFITHMHNPLQNGLIIEAVFRWNPPKAVNEPLVGYKIACWYEKDNSRYDLFIGHHVEPESNEKYMENLPKEATLHCKAKAETISGEGSYSPSVSINTQIEKPIPRLLAASKEGIYIVDFDLKKYSLILNAESRVDHLCFIVLSKELFWINEKHELMSYSRDYKKKLFSINAPVLSLTVDWIERILYWSQLGIKGSSIKAFNLDTQISNTVFKLPNCVSNLNVAPLNRELFWIESEWTSATGTLVSHRFNEDHPMVFRDTKNATVSVTQKTLFLDTFIEGNEKILWLNDHNQLISTDILLRKSTPLNFTYQSNMMNMIRDSGHVYWTQGDMIYAENELELYQQKLFHPMKLLPISSQNYPPIHCLLPREHFNRKDDLIVYDSSDRSLWLRLPIQKRLKDCSFEPTSLKYRIMYAEMVGSHTQFCLPSTCRIIETRERIIEVSNLKPCTPYQFQFSISNYYSEKSDMKTKYTRVRVFRTKIGTPSRPRNVSAKILSPNEINLNWLPPEESNGPSIQYEVQYEIKNEINGYNNQLLNRDDNVTSINITSLRPNQSYSVWIRAYTTETLHNQSLPLKIVTPPDPDVIQLMSSTSTSLTIKWKPYSYATKYVMSYRPADSKNSAPEIILHSNQINSSNLMLSENTVTVLHLHPKSRYTFWLSLWFEDQYKPYIWPQGELFVFETNTDHPNAASKQFITPLQSGVIGVIAVTAIIIFIIAIFYFVSNRKTEVENPQNPVSTSVSYAEYEEIEEQPSPVLSTTL